MQRSWDALPSASPRIPLGAVVGCLLQSVPREPVIRREAARQEGAAPRNADDATVAFLLLRAVPAQLCTGVYSGFLVYSVREKISTVS